MSSEPLPAESACTRVELADADTFQTQLRQCQKSLIPIEDRDRQEDRRAILSLIGELLKLPDEAQATLTTLIEDVLESSAASC